MSKTAKKMGPAAATTTAEQTGMASGTVGACTSDDRPALADLYRASFPEAGFKDFVADLNDAEIPYWSAFKDAEGRLRVAMFAWRNGVVYVVANPDDVESEEVRRGFLRLAENIRARLASIGVAELLMCHTAPLNGFGELLERAGFLGKPFMVMRMMRFTESGEVQRTN